MKSENVISLLCDPISKNVPEFLSTKAGKSTGDLRTLTMGLIKGIANELTMQQQSVA